MTQFLNLRLFFILIVWSVALTGYGQSLNTVAGNGNSTFRAIRLTGEDDIGTSGGAALVLGALTTPMINDTRAFIGWKNNTNTITNGQAGTLLLQARSNIPNVPIDLATGEGTPQLRLRVMGNGSSTKIGIAATNPKGILDIEGDPQSIGNEIYLTGNTNLSQNSNSLRLNFVGYNQKAGFAIQAIDLGYYGNKDLVFSSHDYDIHHDYTSYTEVLRFKYNGKVGIGTADPQAKLDVNGDIFSNGKIFIGVPDGNTVAKIAPHALAVDGSAIFTKAVVKLNTAWPDYVFHADYRRPSVDSLERFIKLHGHLPEIPNAKEVEINGIDLGEMQTLLLKKIEELTLIVIEQNNLITDLKGRVNRLEINNKIIN